MPRGDTVFLTGATGFVGGHVRDALLERGYSVRALVRGDPARLPSREGCTAVRGDLRRCGDLVEAMRGCRYLVHTAALYSFAPRDRSTIHEVNVRGTRGLFVAARLAGVERAVMTSSSATVGPARPDRPATEDDRVEAHRGSSAYHGSKVLQEREALAARVPTVLVLPTAPIGPADAKPTPTGRMVLDVMRGRMWATLGGGMNVVDVRDVAEAHVAALEHGVPGDRYIVGGVNLSLAELFGLIAHAAGRRGPRLRLPYALAAGAGAVDAAASRLLGRTPSIPLEGVRMGRLNMHVSIEKAKQDLGLRPRPIQPAIAEAVAWYRRHGYAA